MSCAEIGANGRAARNRRSGAGNTSGTAHPKVTLCDRPRPPLDEPYPPLWATVPGFGGMARAAPNSLIEDLRQGIAYQLLHVRDAQ
jgi:hypothetical protein